ncbi:MAG: hypothetical protein JWM59_4431 [Verrucomicrobiales bacterium]|nr:hypothetical protein [Verrucomicrobiales bacterium]
MTASDISESEWVIMETLWDHAPRTASEVAQAVRETTGWADNTVRTLLTRLAAKGAVESRRNTPGVREFLPTVQREACVKEESRSFLKRVFRGSAKPLLAHFAENARLSPNEVQELKRLLDESLRQTPSPTDTTNQPKTPILP